MIFKQDISMLMMMMITMNSPSIQDSELLSRLQTKVMVWGTNQLNQSHVYLNQTKVTSKCGCLNV